MASLFSFVVLLSLCLLLSSPFLSNANTKLAFTAELIHRDSPISPLFNPNETLSQRLKNAIHRSVNRVNHFAAKDASLNSLQTEITSTFGVYLMNVSLGTPPFPIMAIADTGSDLIWTQCKPCKPCYTQDAPLFDPKASSTYKYASCSSRQCTAVQKDAPCFKKNRCAYSMAYGDNSYTKGNIATDTLTLGSTNNRPVQLNNFIIGCGHKNHGAFNKKFAGIVGLGNGAVSLISQLGDSIEGKFSYCLVPLYFINDLTSKINFGSNAIVSGPGTVSTPLIKKSPETFYYLYLESISVGSKQIKYPGSNSENCKGNIIIDSGTTLTMLPSEFYFKLEDAVKSSITAKSKQDPDTGFSLCYTLTEDLKLPEITMHFNGADVILNDFNAFVPISKDLVCFAFQPSKSSSLAVYGNLSQMNFLIGYDTVSKKLSFKKADCAKM